MRHIEADLDYDPDDGSFRVSRLTDENGNDVSYYVERATVFRDIAELEKVLAAEFRSPVAVQEA